MNELNNQISSCLTYGVTLQLCVLGFIGVRYAIGRMRRGWEQKDPT